MSSVESSVIILLLNRGLVEKSRPYVQREVHFEEAEWRHSRWGFESCNREFADNLDSW